MVEIMDYCLCSTCCTIPKGKITEFSFLYVLVMAIGEHTYVIARHDWENGGKMYLSKESISFEPKNIRVKLFYRDESIITSRWRLNVH